MPKARSAQEADHDVVPAKRVRKEKKKAKKETAAIPPVSDFALDSRQVAQRMRWAAGGNLRPAKLDDLPLLHRPPVFALKTALSTSIKTAHNVRTAVVGSDPDDPVVVLIDEEIALREALREQCLRVWRTTQGINKRLVFSRDKEERTKQVALFNENLDVAWTASTPHSLTPLLRNTLHPGAWQ